MNITHESQVHSAFDARTYDTVIKDMLHNNFDAQDYDDLRRIGIDFESLDRGALRKMMVQRFGMDSIQQPLTTPNQPSLYQFLQEWLPGLVAIVTAARKIDDIADLMTAGSWEDETVVQTVLENVGTATPYFDLTNVPLSNWNDNYINRNVIRFESGLRVGILEEKRSAKVRINSGDNKRKSAALQLEIQRNAVGFYGYNSGNNLTYGFLNDPSTPAYIQVAAGVGGRTWAVKTFLEICNDIRAAVVQLRTQSQDTIDPEKTDLTMVIATNCVDYLSVVSDFGVSVRDWMKQTYPRIRVVSAPQLNNANGNLNVFYLFANRVEDGLSTDGGQTYIQIVPARFMTVGVEKKVKGYEEDYSNATAGIMLKRPFAVVRYYNI